jgi:poly(3-hydroxybutyrate) depolymerase
MPQGAKFSGPIAAVAMLACAPPLPAMARGLEQRTVTVDGVQRPYLVYVSSKSNSFNAQPLVFALHGDGETAAAFAAHSGWIALAEANGFAVVFPEAGPGGWRADGADSPYLQAVFDEAGQHALSRFPGDTLDGKPRPIWAWETLRYLTGGGAGAAAASAFAIEHPGLFAGVAVMGPPAAASVFQWGDKPADDIFQHARGSLVPAVWKQRRRDVAQAAWILTAHMDAAEMRQAAYWRAALSDAAPVARQSFGPFESQVWRSAAHPAEQVRVTTLPRGAAYGPKVSGAIWNDLFARTVRWTSSPNGDLATRLTPTEIARRFQTRTITLEDGPHSYLVSLPSAYRPGVKLPVVISVHGRYEQVSMFLNKIRMHEVGEKEGFITVYPSGQSTRWASGDPESSDARFMAAIPADLDKAFGIDRSRVYMQGFSNGSAMTHMMGMTYPQLFAAISPNDASVMALPLNGTAAGMRALPNAVPPAITDRVAERKKLYDYRMPVFFIEGAVDSEFTPDGKVGAETPLHWQEERWKAFDDITDPDTIKTFHPDDGRPPYSYAVLGGTVTHAAFDAHYPDGRFETHSYRNVSASGPALYNFTIVTDLPHAYDFREADYTWRYFRQFRRNADGSLTITPNPVR